MKSNKQMLIVSIILLSCLVVGVSFAWWTTTQKQEGNNIFTSACLNISYENETGTISLDNAYPITDVEGQTQEGYSFTIKNNCDEKVAYLVNLDVFNTEGSGILEQNDVNVGIDNRVARTLDNYEDTDKYSSEANYAKNIYSGVLQPNEEYTHNVKMWIDVNVGNEAQQAKFKSQVFVVAGQGINAVEVTPEECFITEGNTIIKYKNYLCGSKVVVPQYINGVEITNFNRHAFTDSNVFMYIDWDNDNTVFVVMDEKNFDEISVLLNENYESEEIWTSNYEILRGSEVTDWSIINSNIFYNDSTLLQVPIGWNSEEEGHDFSWQYCDIANALGSSLLFPDKVEASVEYIDFSRLKNLKVLSNDSVSYNYRLSTVELPEGLNNIYYQAFYYSALTKVFLPTTLTKIGSNAFYENKLSKLEFNSNVYLDRDAFTSNDLTYLETNNTLSFNKPFRNNPNLTTDNIKIGYFSNNTIEEFVAATAEVDE